MMERCKDSQSLSVGRLLDVMERQDGEETTRAPLSVCGNQIRASSKASVSLAATITIYQAGTLIHSNKTNLA